MSICHCIDSFGGMNFKPTGLMLSEEIHAAHNEMHRRLHQEIPYLLVDLLDADGSKLCDQDMRQIADRDCEYLSLNTDLRIGIVIRKNYILIMNELYKDYTGKLTGQVRIFDNKILARAWLQEGLF